MEIFPGKLEEIKTLLSSRIMKPSAYSSLLHLQELHSNNPSSLQSLADSLHALLSSILLDISDSDEEIAAQALKCLGFMVYHPSIVSIIPVDDVNVILDSLVNVVTTTKIKSVCNLGVWCISVQQFSSSILEMHFHSVLRAIVHALNNPIGSLSTTFEAMKAVVKLATQSNEKMRDMSNIWAPPIYRRLVSFDKRERDMSERCLLKIRTRIFPPPLTLSKVLATDVKKILLPAMKELLDNGMKVQTLLAWGWFAYLLGHYTSKNKHLMNEMLKIPEQTFSDTDPQVQIASLVAWERFIDSIICASTQESRLKYCGVEFDRICKRIKLIMTPLIGIMSSKCDVSVLSSCLNTWYYLLHKLDMHVNNPSVMKIIWEPIYEVVFQAGPSSKNTLLWNFCLDLLDNFALARSNDVKYDQLSDQPSANTPTDQTRGPCYYSWKNYHIKWSPWDFSKLNFFINSINNILHQGPSATAAIEIQILAHQDALRIFRSVLKGIQSLLESSSSEYDEIMLCLNAIFRFTIKICQDATSNGGSINYCTALQFVEAVTQELKVSILGSPLYKLAIDLEWIDNCASVSGPRYDAKFQDICFTDSTSTVSPIVFLIKLYFHMVVLSNPHELEGSIMRGICRYVKNLLLSYNYLEILDVFIGLLYKYTELKWLQLWINIAYSLLDYRDSSKDLLPLSRDLSSYDYLVIVHFLAYPFAVCSLPWKKLTQANASCSLALLYVSSDFQTKLDFGSLTEAWKLLYVSLTNSLSSECFSLISFTEELSSILHEFFDENTCILEFGTAWEKEQYLDLISFYGEALLSILEQMLTLKPCSEVSQSKDNGNCKRSSNNTLKFAARFMRLALTNIETISPSLTSVTSRVLSMLGRFIDCHYLKEHILSFMEIISSSLLQWLSLTEIEDTSTKHQLQLLWIEILNCLKKSSSQIKFDSSFLKLHAPLLGKAMDHPNSSISGPTIWFWNATFGEQMKLEYPQSLLHVLDKLYRNGKLNVCKRSISFNEKDASSRLDSISTLQRHRVTAAAQNGISKWEEVPEDDEQGGSGKLPLSSKRRKPSSS